jgi:hypothetical protein
MKSLVHDAVRKRLRISASILLVATLSLGCSAKNPVAKGELIPNTQIQSCGDDLDTLANPAGAFDATATVSATKTELAGKIYWQASCPTTDSTAQTEFSMTTATIYKNDAGYPGDKLGSVPVKLRAIASCADRMTTQIGGITKSDALEPFAITDLAALCDDFKKNPTGAPLFIQVELSGTSTACSSNEYPLLFRSKVGVNCP